MTRPPTLLAVLEPIEAKHFFPEPLFDQLRAIAPDFQLLDPTDLSDEQFAAKLAAANPAILLSCWRTPRLPTQLPSRLRYVCYLAGSVKSVVSRQHLENGLLLTNWGGAISRVVAEGALLHILACLRRSARWTIAMHQQGAWKNGVTDAASLFERRVGIHGFGPVARELTRLLRPFNCAIEVFAPDVDATCEREFGVTRAASLESLFQHNQIVVELAPLIPETKGAITGKLLRLLAPGSVFVNVGRGAVVDEDALVRVAREGQVLFGLDVFTREPLDPDHPLRGLPNVFLTPHLSGPTADRYPDATALALRNLRAFTEGRPLEAVITPEVYDRST